MNNQPNDQQYKRLLKAVPGKILVLKPGSYEIVAVTDAYLQATMTRESDLVGKTLFEVFPDNPADFGADGVESLARSLQRVESLKASDIMGVKRYPIRHPDGGFEERFWSPVNSPILDDAGDIEFIAHRVEDVTAIVAEGAVADAREAGSGGGDTVAVQEIVLRSQELRQALSKLQEYEVRMRTAERMLKLGTWEYDLKTGSLNWSQQVFDIYGVPTDRPAPDFEDYFALLHPDDREASRAVYEAFIEQNAPRIEFEHRVIARDGSVRHIKGVGERHRLADGEIVVGCVQDITALVATRHRLTQAEQLLRLAGEKVRLGGWRVELDSKTVIWTPETAVIHGLPAGYSPPSVSEAIEFYAPEYRDLVQSAFVRCAHQGESFDVICQLQTADGQRLWVRSIGAPEWDQEGAIIAVRGAFQDITALREAQAQAEEAERQRIDVLESIGDAFFAVDKKWNFTYLNNQASLLVERHREELIGNNLWEKFPGMLDIEFQRQYQLALEIRQTTQFEAYYSPLGKWFDVSAYPIPDGLAVYFRDVTSERERRQRLRLVDAALSRQNDIVMITEADAIDAPDGPRIIYVNEAFERLTGYTQSEAIGQTPRFLQGPKTERQQLDKIRRALEGKKPIRREILNYDKSGEVYWVELDITPLLDEEGRCTHFVAVERDITGRVEIEQQLREAQKLEAVGHLTGGIAHDFNNILTIILGNAEALAEQLTDPKLRPMAEMTVSAADRGAQLTSRLLAFARRQPLDPKPTDINQLVESMQALIRRTLPESIDLEFVPDPDPGIAEIDAGEMDSALLNLVVNARDAIQENGKLTIETANVVLDSNYANVHPEVVPGEYCMVSVSDTGKGMDPVTIRRAFEPFFTTKEVGKGSGLGLSMVFGFTKQSGGHVKIYSEPGEGTSVKLYFPRLQAGTESGFQPTAKVPLPGGAEHILIAEDDDLVLEHLKNQLLSLGYRVTAAMSGPEALSALQAQDDVDLLLTDVVMPGGMNGRDLADRAQAARPSLKVLFTSGYTENAIVHHGRLDPGVALLSKPYTRLELATKVRRVLDCIPIDPARHRAL